MKLHCLVMLFAFSCLHAEVITEFTHDGHTYRVYGSDDERDWEDANTFAQTLTLNEQTGHLVRIDSATENAAIFDQLVQHDSSFTRIANDGGGIRYVWIGANDRASEGAWLWSNNDDPFWNGSSNGTSVADRYQNWGTGARFSPNVTQNEPDNFGSGQDAAAIALSTWPNGSSSGRGLGDAGQWNDISENNTLPFIVEFDTVTPSDLSLVNLQIEQSGSTTFIVTASGLPEAMTFSLERSSSLVPSSFGSPLNVTGAQLMTGVEITSSESLLFLRLSLP